MEKMLNCNSKTLEKLFVDSHEWNTVIKNLNHVRVEEKREELELNDFADPKSVWPIIEEAGINVHYETSVLRQLVSGGKMTSAYPRDLFVANVDDPTAKKLSGRNGCLVVPQENPSLEQITQPVLELDLTEGEKFSWHDCFLYVKESPSVPINSLVLIDRYLFVRYSPYGWLDGIQNVKRILSEALPPVLSERFDVLIITSNDKFDYQAKRFDRIIDRLYQECRKLRPYEINFEVLVIGSEGDKRIWDESHDRRIISNYYRMAASKGFFAFVGQNYDTVFRSQTITIDCAYSNINNKFAHRFGFPVKGYDSTLSEIYEFVAASVGWDDYLFYKNGIEQRDISTFSNRIVLMQK